MVALVIIQGRRTRSGKEDGHGAKEGIKGGIFQFAKLVRGIHVWHLGEDIFPFCENTFGDGMLHVAKVLWRIYF